MSHIGRWVVRKKTGGVGGLGAAESWVGRPPYEPGPLGGPRGAESSTELQELRRGTIQALRAEPSKAVVPVGTDY